MICSISFNSEIKEQLGVKLVAESKGVDLECKVRVLILVVSEFRNVTSIGNLVRLSISEKHDNFQSVFISSSFIRWVL